ncbi:MAG: HAMP domain-containing histidine kinase [Chloroflexota bacterium]|nr:HAMP domain-containing histidine kinase [Chloroflexota bacterium]
MAERPNSSQLSRQGRELSMLRWAVLGAMLVITLTWPVYGRTGHPVWVYILVFAGYNLLVELLRRLVARFRSIAWVPVLDLPAAAVLYYFDADPGGPLFVIFYLGLIYASASMSLRGSLLYTAAVVFVVAMIAPTLPLWSATDRQLRELASRLVVLALVGVGTNILMRRWAEQQQGAQVAEHARERMLEMDRLRRRFILSVSHELRTPLTALRAGLGLLEMSAGKELGAEQRLLLTNARRNTERLRSFIDELLAYNEAEAGTLSLVRWQLDLRDVVAEALPGVLHLVHEKGQTVEADMPEPLPVEGDRRKLEHVVTNLLANANKHAPIGALIRVSGRTTGDEVVLSVSDDGPAIAAGDGDASLEHSHHPDPIEDATGLGLALTRGIVELHGGRIWVDVVEGRGTEFRVALPSGQNRREL